MHGALELCPLSHRRCLERDPDPFVSPVAPVPRRVDAYCAGFDFEGSSSTIDAAAADGGGGIDFSVCVVPSTSIVPPARWNAARSSAILSWVNAVRRSSFGLRKRSLVLDVGDCGFDAMRSASAHQGDWKRVQRACSFCTDVATIWPGHRELATDGRARFVDAAVHLRAVQRNAPTVGVARHHGHALFVACGQMRRNRVFLEQHHGQAAAQGVAAVAVHALFADRWVHRDTGWAPSSMGCVGGTGKAAGMVAPGRRHPGGG